MKKYDNFCRALHNLKEIESRQPPYDTITQTGMVSLFEICFEQSWKAMKEVLEYSGYSEHRIGSPRAIIKMAYQAGMIQDEDVWVDALHDRNNVAHSVQRGDCVVHYPREQGTLHCDVRSLAAGAGTELALILLTKNGCLNLRFRQPLCFIWSGQAESNRPLKLGKLPFYR